MLKIMIEYDIYTDCINTTFSTPRHMTNADKYRLPEFIGALKSILNASVIDNKTTKEENNE